MSSYAIIGFGCAGYQAARAIRGRDESGVIDVFSDVGFAPSCGAARNMKVNGAQNVPDKGLQGVTRADFDLTKRDRAFIKTEYLCINVTPGGVLSLPGVVYQFAFFVVQEAPDLLK